MQKFFCLTGPLYVQQADLELQNGLYNSIPYLMQTSLFSVGQPSDNYEMISTCGNPIVDLQSEKIYLL